MSFPDFSSVCNTELHYLQECKRRIGIAFGVRLEASEASEASDSETESEEDEEQALEPVSPIVQVEVPAAATVPATEQVEVEVPAAATKVVKPTTRQKKKEELVGVETVPNIRSRLRPRNRK